MYKFDTALTSQSAFKERFVWLVYLGIVFFLLYGSANNLSDIRDINISLYMQWERNIPFVESFIIPYMSSDLLFIIAFLLPQTRLSLRILALRSFFAIVISVAIFTLIPLKFAFAKPPTDNFLFDMLKLDLPYNQMPSLHVSLAVILWFCMKENIKSTFAKSALFVWLILVVLSTLLVAQHHFIDLPTGFLLGILIVLGINKNSILILFTTPRSIKVALYYLSLSVVFMVLSLKFLSYFSFYLFVCVFLISIIYAFGFNTLLCRDKKRANIIQQILFLPYFLGSHISWIYYKRKIPFISKYNENIYFGRQPSMDEYKNLKELGITKIINLCPELQYFSTNIKELRYTLLDLTIQEPKKLAQIVTEIDCNEKVYIHCKLGMSRTILVISAYMISKNIPLKKVEKTLQKTRDFYLKSIYMSLNFKFIKEHCGLN